jgi:hypothetical protein
LIVFREAVIRRVTSQSLGSLAPGYAASRSGFVVYAALVGALGLIVLSLDLMTRTAAALYLLIAGVVIFVAGSIVVIVGEVVTYRALKR